MTRFVDTQIARIPVRGPGVPDGFCQKPTTSWMPYTWSLNNVVMAEVAHASLAYWEAGRPDAAFALFKGCMVDGMFMGLCPGNVGMSSYFDMARREAQRDFGDAIGVYSRTLVEGLFGVHPDALGGEIRVRPGFPADWNSATMRHPDFNFEFQRDGLKESYRIESRFAKPMRIRLQAAALRDGVVSVVLNGRRANWRALEDSVGSPRIEIEADASPRTEMVITWKGERPAGVEAPSVVAVGTEIRARFGAARLRDAADPERALSKLTTRAGQLRGVASGTGGHRTAFAKLEQVRVIYATGERSGTIDAVLRSRRETRRVGATVPHFHSVVELVASTDLAGVVPERFAKRMQKTFDLRVLPLPIRVPPLRIVAAWNERKQFDEQCSANRSRCLRRNDSLRDGLQRFDQQRRTD